MTTNRNPAAANGGASGISDLGASVTPTPDKSQAAAQRRYYLNRVQQMRTALEYVEAAQRVTGPHQYLSLGLCRELHDLAEVAQALRSDMAWSQARADGWTPPWERPDTRGGVAA